MNKNVNTTTVDYFLFSNYILILGVVSQTHRDLNFGLTENILQRS